MTDDPYRSKRSPVFLALGALVVAACVFRILGGFTAVTTILGMAARQTGGEGTPWWRMPGAGPPELFAVVLLVGMSAVFVAALVVARRSSQRVRRELDRERGRDASSRRGPL
jgi:ABC-type antimicrobial peptide transport system permease subunit